MPTLMTLEPEGTLVETVQALVVSPWKYYHSPSLAANQLRPVDERLMKPRHTRFTSPLLAPVLRTARDLVREKNFALEDCVLEMLTLEQTKALLHNFYEDSLDLTGLNTWANYDEAYRGFFEAITLLQHYRENGLQLDWDCIYVEDLESDDYWYDDDDDDDPKVLRPTYRVTHDADAPFQTAEIVDSYGFPFLPTRISAYQSVPHFGLYQEMMKDFRSPQLSMDVLDLKRFKHDLVADPVLSKTNLTVFVEKGRHTYTVFTEDFSADRALELLSAEQGLGLVNFTLPPPGDAPKPAWRDILRSEQVEELDPDERVWQ